MPSTFLQNLKHRRVPQILGLYLGTCWGIIQFTTWLVERYLLTEILVDIAAVTLFSLIPTVFLLAYTHGAPGKDHWTRLEKVGVPCNLAVTLGLLVFIVYGEDLGATATKIELTDEEGQTIERLVPKEAFRRRAALFFWDNRTGDESLDWLQYGLPAMLAADLSQDLFLDIWTPHAHYSGRSAFARLRSAGHEDGLTVPLALLQEVAAEIHRGHFVTGSFTGRADQLDLSLTLYQTDPVRELATHSVSGADPQALVDQLTPLLKRDLEVPESSEQLADDLPIGEQWSQDLSAIEAYVAGQNALLFDNDYAAAVAHWQRCVERDPSFARTYLELSTALLNQGELQAAAEAIAAGLRHDYKLTEGERIALRGLSYSLQGDFERRTRLNEMWTELEPTNVNARIALATAYRWTGNRVDQALATYEEVYTLDPSQDWVLLEIGKLAKVRGDREAAIAHFKRYATLHRDEQAPLLSIGMMQQEDGDLAAAREAYERAALVDTGRVGPLLHLASLDLAEGDVGGARRQLDEAEATAFTPQAAMAVLEARLAFHERRGQSQQAFALLPRIEAAAARFANPVSVMMDGKILYLDRYVPVGKRDEAEAQLAAFAAQLDPPMDEFVNLGYLFVAMRAQDAAAMEVYRGKAEAAIARWHRQDLSPITENAKASALALRGRHAEAAEAYRHTLALYEGSIQSSEERSSKFELLVQLGRSRRLAGDPEAAADALEQTLAAIPYHPEANLEMARLQQAAGNTAAARRHLEKALHIWAEADESFTLAQEARDLAAQLAS